MFRIGKALLRIATSPFARDVLGTSKALMALFGLPMAFGVLLTFL